MRDVRRQEKQWEMMRQHLSAESQGKEPQPFASTRTLFGIRSTVEQQLDEYVARQEARRARELSEEKAKRSGAARACVIADAADGEALVFAEDVKQEEERLPLSDGARGETD